MSSAATTATPDVSPPRVRHPESSVKETVESILVAFILAFIFRAFVVEAFVIPTGSMAPTLLGAHTRFTCTDCGYKYAVNYSSGNSDLSIPSADIPIAADVECPNCGYRESEAARAKVPVHYGDRILVLKYRYLLEEPQRWDVVVFKSPDTGTEAAPRFTTNYIKRLIGKPGESIMMLDGDIYVSTAPPPEDLSDPEAFESFLKTFQVQHKPHLAQQALWRVVYHNDYLPHLESREDRSQWQQPWKVEDGAGWNVGQSLPAAQAGRVRTFAFDAPEAGGRLAFDALANYTTYALTDTLAYDQHQQSVRDSRPPQRLNRDEFNLVGDLRVTCFYTREAGDGPFDMLLSKRDDQFVARLLRGKVQLTWTRQDQVVKTYEADVPELAGAGTPVELAFANVDFRVGLRVNGREVISTGNDYLPTGDEVLRLQQDEENRANARPKARRDPDRGSRIDSDLEDQRKGLPRAELYAEKQSCKLEHLVLWRDTFYVNDKNEPEPQRTMRVSTLRGSPRSILSLGPDEFFVMGDNPWISADARVWNTPVDLPGEQLFVQAGRVPRRFLLGKAFFVYWPAGYRASFLPFSLIPNFGEMRFIQ